MLDGLRSLCDDPVGTEFVIFEGARGFVQFAPAGLTGLIGEAVANTFLDEGAALSPDEIGLLLGLGWEEPDKGWQLQLRVAGTGRPIGRHRHRRGYLPGIRGHSRQRPRRARAVLLILQPAGFGLAARSPRARRYEVSPA